RFPDGRAEPQFNSVDASLWFIIAIHDYLKAMDAASQRIPSEVRQNFRDTTHQILTHYSARTRFGIRADEDGLLFAGEAGQQLTWMDAKVGDWVVTPRIGKPVEVQALWINS